MKYCTHCGNEILDEAIICPKCGCKVEQLKTVYKAPKQLDVAKEELCPNGFLWPWMLCYMFCSLFGVFSLIYGIMYKNYLHDAAIHGLIVTFGVIAIICFVPTIIMTIIANQKKWTHYSWGSKTYPIRIFMGYIFGPLGLICAIIGLIL